MLNKILLKNADLIKNDFESIYNFDFENLIQDNIKKYESMKSSAPSDLAKYYSKILEVSLENSIIYPYFKSTSNGMILKSPFFEIHRLSFFLNSFLRGVNQFISAETIDGNKANQFKIFSYYSSSFHSISAYLSAHGIVYIPKVWDEINLEEIEKLESGSSILSLPVGKKFIRGHYNNKWSFSANSAKHNQRWIDFTDILKKYLRNNWGEEIPKEVEKFWGYMHVLGEYPKHSWKKGYMYSFNFLNKKEFISTLNKYPTLPCNVRHERIYEDRYFDLLGHTKLVQEGKISKELRTSEISYFSSFSKSLINWNYEIIKDILSYITHEIGKEKLYYGLNSLEKTSINHFSKLTFYNLELYRSEIDKIDPNLYEYLKCLVV